MSNFFIGIIIGYFIGQIITPVIESWMELILFKIEQLKQNIKYDMQDAMSDIQNSLDSEKPKNPIGFKYEGSENKNGNKKKKK